MRIFLRKGIKDEICSLRNHIIMMK